jgi:hypothetical protein
MPSCGLTASARSGSLASLSLDRRQTRHIYGQVAGVAGITPAIESESKLDVSSFFLAQPFTAGNRTGRIASPIHRASILLELKRA